MTIVSFNNKYYSFPTCWNDLTLVQLCRILPLVKDDTMDTGKKLLLLFKLLTGMSRWRFLWIQCEEVIDKAYLVDFLFSDNTLTKNLIPDYNCLYGPADDFNNMVVGEFVFSENYYQQYNDTKTLSDLNMLVATLYRPAKPWYNKKLNKTGDVREPFNDNLTSHFAVKICHWPMEIKHAIVFWYEGCRAGLFTKYPDVFGGSGEPAKRGLLSNMVAMAETGTFGDFDKVERLLLNTFFIGISESMHNAKMMDKKNP